MNSFQEFGRSAARGGATIYLAGAGSIAVTILTGFASAAKLPAGFAYAMTVVATLVAAGVIWHEWAAFGEMRPIDAFAWRFQERANRAVMMLIGATASFVVYVWFALSTNLLAAIPLIAFSFLLNRFVAQTVKYSKIKEWRERQLREASPEWKKTLSALEDWLQQDDQENVAFRSHLAESSARDALNHVIYLRDLTTGRRGAMFDGRYSRLERSGLWSYHVDSELFVFVPSSATSGSLAAVLREVSGTMPRTVTEVSIVPEYRDGLSLQARRAIEGVGWHIADEHRPLREDVEGYVRRVTDEAEGPPDPPSQSG